MARFGLVPITLDRDIFDVGAIKRILRNTAESLAKDVLIDFKVTTQTWTNKPKFNVTRMGGREGFTRIVGTDNDIYKFVSGGTRVRYAVMTPGFVAKTRVKVIGSGKGKGGFSHMNFKKPKPGIEAREFEYEIADKWQKLIPNIVERAILQEIDTK